jgi:histone-lysine N-methyltransferase SETMAR
MRGFKSGSTAFKDGCMSADSDQRSGRPSTSRNADVIDKVRTLIMEDRRLTVREIADEVGISRGSANTILTEDVGMRRVAAKFVPKLLSPEQQQLCLEVAQDMLECANRDPEFLKTVITQIQNIFFPAQGRILFGQTS